LVSGAWTPLAAAAPVEIPMDSAADFESQGFENFGDGGSSSFAGGMMTVDTTGYEEWILYDGTPSKWWDHVDPSKGWWVEARLRVDSSDVCPAPGMWIHDRGNLFVIRFGVGEVAAEPGGSVPFDTSGFHVYRLEDFGDGTRHLLADGQVLIDLSAMPGGAGTLSLSLGDLGGCGQSTSVWDYYSYDTFAPGQEDGDADADGIVNAEDNCFETANPDQANADGDGLGDVCDPCPADALGDSDGDGLCDSDDGCPSDPTITEGPCPSDSSGFQGDGFGELGGEFSGGDSLTTAGTGSSTGMTSVASAGENSGSGGGSGAGASEADGCSCRGGGPATTSAWWTALAIAGAGRRRRGRPLAGKRASQLDDQLA
jgi:MYXO-CTERM domain-containing protein